MVDPHVNSYTLAGLDAIAPVPSSYWVVPNLLLAGAFPGAKDADRRRQKIQALLDFGVRIFINLMEADETNMTNEPFEPYDQLAVELDPDVQCHRFPIRDLSIPTRETMEAILATLDESLAAKRMTYVHCWGGVGRTGTTIGCWLLRHKLATSADVLNVIAELRQQDDERRHRMSPETAEQQRFVKQWLDRC